MSKLTKIALTRYGDYSDVMLSPYCFVLAGLCRNYSTNFHKIRQTRAMKESVRFYW